MLPLGFHPSLVSSPFYGTRLTPLAFASNATLGSSRVDAELALIERIADAEPRAVGEAYDAHHGAVRAFAERLVGEAAAAEDLVHEVFLALPSAAQKFEGRSSLRTFLISIAVNRAHHFVRKASRRRKALDRLEKEPSPGNSTPEHLTERRQLAHALSRALDTLPVDQRVAFVLCEVEDRSSREAAEIMSVPEGTVRTRVFHAKRKLRIELEREGFR
ncbi:MAG TPA: RNA polymerase sigma factor [Polyangiaceae bacterium]|nr:RNA polymerase sigma factor [Polyangiaceae bacterium]